MNQTLFYKYYDQIFSEKDYKFESKIILGILRKRSPHIIKNVLDIGCGTGAHAQNFNSYGVNVFGIDTDPAAIDVASRKPSGTFVNCSVHDVRKNDFDGAISLFNVINYLTDESSLLSFMSETIKRIRPKGVFIADAWNGKAALRNPPQQKTKQIITESQKTLIKIIPSMNNATDVTDISMFIQVTEDNEIIEEFEVNYQHRLWQPNQITKIFKLAGFDSTEVVNWMDPESKANSNNWKIMYICKKA